MKTPRWNLSCFETTFDGSEVAVVQLFLEHREETYETR